MTESVLEFLVVAAITIAVFLLAKAWEAMFDPMPESIEDARPGTLLVHFDREGEKRVKRNDCDEIDSYYIEELASDWLAWAHCVRVELKTTERKVYVFTQRSIKQRGW